MKNIRAKKIPQKGALIWDFLKRKNWKTKFPSA